MYIRQQFNNVLHLNVITIKLEVFQKVWRELSKKQE